MVYLLYIMATFKEFAHKIFEEINCLRECPKEFAEKMKNEFKHYKENNVRHRPGTVPLYTREGINAIEEAYHEVLKVHQLSHLEWSHGLSCAATDHCIDTGRLGIVGHIGSQETSLQGRIERYGKWSGSVIEALDYGSITAFEVVMSLIIDDGLTTRPHRKAILNPSFTKIGVGAAAHTEFKTITCIIFSVNFTQNDDISEIYYPDDPLPSNPVIEDWLEGAVKVTCEIREETEYGRKVKKIKKHWQMADGTIRTVEENIIEPDLKEQEHKKEEMRLREIEEARILEEEEKRLRNEDGKEFITIDLPIQGEENIIIEIPIPSKESHAIEKDKVIHQHEDRENIHHIEEEKTVHNHEKSESAHHHEENKIAHHEENETTHSHEGALLHHIEKEIVHHHEETVHSHEETIHHSKETIHHHGEKEAEHHSE